MLNDDNEGFKDSLAYLIIIESQSYLGPES